MMHSPPPPISRRLVLAGIAASIAASRAEAQPQTNVLASWNDGPAKQAILEFVRASTDRSSHSFVAPEDRVATFDQDGTLWVEHPIYTQAMFALDRVHTLAPQHPEWHTREPFRAVLGNDRAVISHLSERDGRKLSLLRIRA